MLLMFKDTPVAEVITSSNIPIGYKKIFEEELCPKGTVTSNKIAEPLLFKEWIKSRSIPSERQNIKRIQYALHCTPSDLFVKNLGVSLTDSYWLKEEGSPLTWGDVNYYSNPFESNLFQILDKRSPDFTTDGCLEKYWISNCGIPYLVKFDTKQGLLAANEVTVTRIASLLGIEVTPYHLLDIKGRFACACPCFFQDDERSFLNFLSIKHDLVNKKRCDKTVQFFIENELGFKKEIEQLKLLDILTFQKDRHERNLGISLKENNYATAKMIPFFDNGTCLGCNYDSVSFMDYDDLKFFLKTRERLASEIECSLDVESSNLTDILQETYEEFKISEERYEIAKVVLDSGISLLKPRQYEIDF